MTRTAMRSANRSNLQLAAEVMEFWRLCGKSRCRRARACRGDASECCARLAAWSETLSSKDKRIGFAEAMQLLRERHT